VGEEEEVNARVQASVGPARVRDVPRARE
jgi:hypothetical protein